MADSSRDEIWKAAYYTLYDSGYNEIFSDNIMGKWQHFDDLTKVLAAITATGSSAAAGLAIWSADGFKQVWVVLAALGVILSITSAALRAPERLKAWANSKQEFGALYVELETFMFRMRINREFSVDEFGREFEIYRKRYGEAKQRIPTDKLATEKLATLSQQALNSRIERSTLSL